MIMNLLFMVGDIASADYWIKEELAGYLPFNLTTGAPQI